MSLIRLLLAATLLGGAACAQLPQPASLDSAADVRSGPKIGPGNPKSRGMGR